MYKKKKTKGVKAISITLSGMIIAFFCFAKKNSVTKEIKTFSQITNLENQKLTPIQIQI
jgi:hypothetical protein